MPADGRLLFGDFTDLSASAENKSYQEITNVEHARKVFSRFILLFHNIRCTIDYTGVHGPSLRIQQ